MAEPSLKLTRELPQNSLRGIRMQDDLAALKERGDEFLRQQAAYYNGILNVPQEAIKYSGLGANWVREKIGAQTPTEAKIRSQQIREFMDNPPVLPNAVNAYRNWLATNNPVMDSVGNIVGSSFAGANIPGKGLAKAIKSTKLSNPAMAAAIGSETLIEPYLNDR